MPELLSWLVDNNSLFRKSRLPSLYSDLAVQKRTNPEGYAANVTAWQSALTEAALAGQLPSDDRLILSCSGDLIDALVSSEYGRPSGLGLVLDDSVRSGRMFEKRDFLNAVEGIYQRNWIPRPLSVLKWGLRQVGITSGHSLDVDGRLRSAELVLVPALEEISKRLLSSRNAESQSMVDRVMTREMFLSSLTQLTSVQLTSQDAEVLLRYLQRDKQMLSYDSNTVKFKPTTATTAEAITPEDATIASLRSLILRLTSQTSDLNARIASLQANVQAAIKIQNKTAALSALKSKKLAERSLQQRSETLSQLEDIFSKIEQAVDQVQIVDAMQVSAGVLKTLNTKVGGVERVDNVVDSLREQMEKVDELSQILQEPLDGNKLVDEAELDDELEAMEREETKLRDQQKQEREIAAVKKQMEDLQRAEAESRRKEAQKLEKQEQDLAGSIQQLDRMSIEEIATGDRQPEQVAE